MNKDEFEQKFNDGAKGAWAWTQTHTTAAGVIAAFVVGFIFGALVF